MTYSDGIFDLRCVDVITTNRGCGVVVSRLISIQTLVGCVDVIFTLRDGANWLIEPLGISRVSIFLIERRRCDKTNNCEVGMYARFGVRIQNRALNEADG